MVLVRTAGLVGYGVKSAVAPKRNISDYIITPTGLLLPSSRTVTVGSKPAIMYTSSKGLVTITSDGNTAS